MSIKLAEMLLSSKVISDGQLNHALDTQKQVGGKLGVILTKLRMLTEDQLAKFLADSLKIPLLALKDLVVQKDVSLLVDVEVLEKHEVLPIRRTQNSLLVAAVDPMDLDAFDELSFVTSLRVEPAVVTRSNLKKAIDYYCHGKRCPELEQAEKDRGVSSGHHAAVKDGTPASPQAVLQALTELLIEKKVITQDELLQKVNSSSQKV